MIWLFTTLLTFNSLAQTSTRVHDEDSKLDKFRDQVRIIRSYEGGWDISFKTRKGVYQSEKGRFDDLLRESHDDQTLIEIEADRETNQISSVKKVKIKPDTDKKSEF